tara:strand:- start:23 stop:313 length:291 start_codon:yes stop_codon:yes gene_type:complete
MNLELKNILEEIDNTSFFKDYKEFRLSKDIDMNQKEMKDLILSLNNRPKTKALYNSVTKNCDTIGVIDVVDTRFIDFDDNYYTLLNKGIDRQTDKV